MPPGRHVPPLTWPASNAHHNFALAGAGFSRQPPGRPRTGFMSPSSCGTLRRRLASRAVASTRSRAEQHLGSRASTRVREGFERTVRWYPPSGFDPAPRPGRRRASPSMATSYPTPKKRVVNLPHDPIRALDRRGREADRASRRFDGDDSLVPRVSPASSASSCETQPTRGLMSTRSPSGSSC